MTETLIPELGRKQLQLLVILKDQFEIDLVKNLMELLLLADQLTVNVDRIVTIGRVPQHRPNPVVPVIISNKL